MCTTMRSCVTSFLILTILIFGFGTTLQAGSGTSGKENTPATPQTAEREAGASGGDASPQDEDNDPDMPAFLQGKLDKQTYLQLRSEYIGRLRGIDPANPPAPNVRVNAIHTLEQQEQTMRDELARRSGTGPAGSIPPFSPPSWTELGPFPIPNGQTTPTEVAVSGRVTAIAVHPTNPNIIYVGAAQGGVYRSLNGGTTWTQLMDSALSLAVGAIAIAPSQPSTIYVGTGEGNFSADSFFGVGVYRIDNADTSPVLVGPLNKDGGSNDIFTGRAISQILVHPTDPNTIFVSSTSGISGLSGSPFSVLPSRGLYRSTNAAGAAGSVTFTQLTVATVSSNRSITDIAMEPGNPNNLVTAVFGNAVAGDGGYYRTTNALAATPTFTQTLVLNAITMKFAINKVGSTVTVLAGSGDGGGATGTLRISTDGGATWGAAVAAANGFCGGQCFYDAPLAIKPDDANTFFVGGSAGSSNPGAASLKKTINGGTSFTIPNGTLHADTHVIVYAPSDFTVMYEGNDGGIWRSADGGNTWTSINTSGFSATQFQSLALHPTDRQFMIGGTQDNGTEFKKPDASWTRADFGDGGYALIDQSAVDTTNVTMYHTYFNQSNNLIGYAHVTGTANATEGNWNFSGCNGNVSFNGITCADAVLFYAPMAVGPGTPNTVYYGSDRLYRSANIGTNNTVVSQAPIVSTVPISTIGISPQNDNVRIVGLRNGKVFATTTGSSTLTDVTGAIPAHYVARAVIDPNNVNTAYVTLDDYGLAANQHVWKTTNLNNATPTWTASGSGIPDVPTNSIVIDPTNSNSLFVGTDIGVYHSADGGASWSPYGTGLPRVAVFDIAIQSTNHILRAATHGRGLWEIASVTILPPTISKSFGAASIPLNGSTSLSFTINNPNASTSLSGIGFGDTLPTGLVVATPNGLTGSCGGGTITATAASSSVSLASATLAASTGCTFSVNVTGTTAGVKSNTTGAVSSTEGGTGATASASLNVDGPPTLGKAFNPTTIAVNATSLLTFTVTNPAANPDALTGVAFSDTLPVGLTVANGTFGNCSGGTVTTTAPRTIALSSGTIAVNSQCTFGVTVTGAVAGSYTNTTGNVTSTNGGTGGTATANLTVAAAPTISKSFGALTIPLNGTTSLSFTINNPNAGSSLTGVSFSDTLPAGLVVSTPNGLTGSCGGGTITATAGSGSVSLAGATLGASTGCTFSVNVTGTTAGAKNNTTGNVTATESGAGLTASASVTVIGPPTISKSFGAATVPLNGSTSLSFTINNPNASNSLSGIGFTDTLPTGLVVATPNGLTGSCGGGTITATAASSSVSLSGATLAASTGCTFSVNVTGTTAGAKANTTSAVTSTEGGTGGTSNTANLTVVGPPSITKAFGAPTVALNQSVSLTFTINNPNGGTALNGIGFTDTMPAGLSVAVGSFSNTCGASFSGTNSTTIVISGGILAAGASCNVSGNVTGIAPGLQSNSVTINSNNGGTGNTSLANVTVVGPPTIGEAFGVPSMLDTGTTTLTFTLSNPNTSTTLTGIGFTDPVLTNLAISTPNGLTGTCLTVAGGVTNAGIVTATSGQSSLSLSGLGLAASSSCTFTVNVTGNNPGFSGTITNTTNAVTSTNGGNGGTGTATIFLLVPPTIGKAFSPVTVAVNGTSTLTFTLSNGNVAGAGSGLSGMGFTDTFPANLVVATPNGLSNTCGGTPTAVAGSGSVSLSGVSLTGGASCTLAVNVTGTTAGLKNNVSGAVTSNEAGPGNTAAASLGVAAPPTISKAFGASTIPLNGSTSLTLTITNPTSGVALSGVAFTDNLPAGLIVATPNNLNNNGCSGTATAVAGSSSVSLSGGTLAGNSSCTITLNVTGTTSGTKSNTTGAVTATESGAGTTSNTAVLTVVAPPTISKAFGAPRIAVTGTATLTFTINNPNSGTPLTGVGFSDTLPAGLVINTPNGLSGSCGGGTITATQNTNVISLSGASLAASTGCTFSVNVLGTAGGDQNNTTGNVTSIEGGTGGTASATINVIAPPTLSLAFNPTTIALSATTSLQFTITNPAANTTALNGVAFTDTLPAGLTVASNGGASQCGGTLTTTNPTTIHLAGATVNQNSQCVFSVTVTGAVAGNYSNLVSGGGAITSTTGGIGATGPASNTANLTVAAPPVITKSFGASTVPKSGTVSLTFNINNPNTTAALTGIAFTDNLPSGLFDGNPPNLNNTCGGTATANAGTTVITLSGATLPANSSCSVTLNILGVSAGLKNNSVQVTSNEGGTGNTSNASVTVVYPPVLMKSFGTASIPLNGTTSLTFSLSTINATTTLTGISFSDPLPGGLIISTPNGLTSNCGGTVTATQGTSVISLSGGTLAPSTSCNIVVNVTGTAVGTQNNTTSAATSIEGGTGTNGMASLNVDGPPTVAKAFGAGSIAQNGTTTLTFTLTNPAANPDTLTGIGFTDNLQSGIVVATPNGLTGSCLTVAGAVTNAGSVTAVAGSTSISLSALALTSNGTCTFTVNVTGTLLGNNIPNTTSTVISTNGGTGATSNTATLTVGGADLSVSLTHHPDPAAFGGKLIFVATVTNHGPSSANVTFQQTFTGAQYLVSASSTLGSCVAAEPVNCNLGNMTNGQTATVTIVVTPLLGRTIMGTATVTPDVTDPNQNNNTASSTARIRIKPQHF